MNNDIKHVCVYCASSSKISSVYQEAATELGHLLAQNQQACVCGAGFQGLMKILSDAVMENNGKVIGIIPRFMYEEGWGNDSLSELIVTETIHERKEKMAALSDAVIALPGGCGTMEELLEIITWKQLGLFNGLVIILNTNGYYDPLLTMLDKSIHENFMRKELADCWMVASNPDEAIRFILSTKEDLKNLRKFAVL